MGKSIFQALENQLRLQSNMTSRLIFNADASQLKTQLKKPGLHRKRIKKKVLQKYWDQNHHFQSIVRGRTKSPKVLIPIFSQAPLTK